MQCMTPFIIKTVTSNIEAVITANEHPSLICESRHNHHCNATTVNVSTAAVSLSRCVNSYDSGPEACRNPRKPKQLLSWHSCTVWCTLASKRLRIFDRLISQVKLHCSCFTETIFFLKGKGGPCGSCCGATEWRSPRDTAAGLLLTGATASPGRWRIQHTCKCLIRSQAPRPPAAMRHSPRIPLHQIQLDTRTEVVFTGEPGARMCAAVCTRGMCATHIHDDADYARQPKCWISSFLWQTQTRSLILS